MTVSTLLRRPDVCQQSVDAIAAAGGNSEFIKVDQPGWWQGKYSGPYGKAYVVPSPASRI